MKANIPIGCAVLAVSLFSFPAAFAANPPKLATHFDFSSDTTPGARKFYFETLPGHRYTLWRSTDLQNWTTLPGYPQTATGLSMEHTFAQGEKEFFQIEAHDDQAPVIEEQFPAVDGYAVRRFDDFRFLLSDATGIDPSSIRLTVGGGAAMSLGATGLSYVNDVLTYDSGDTALGAYGATVPVTLTVADTLGHAVNHTFSFTLEVQPKVVPNLYVFGSPTAQRAGQRIPATPTAALARQQGPVRMDDGDPWEITSILPDRVVIAYTGAAAPVFAINTYLTNLTPVKLSDIFYRKILSVNDDAGLKQLTLMTADVPFAEIVEEGTSTISADSVVYDLGADGSIQPAVEIGYSKTFPRVGIDLDNASPDLPGNPKFDVSLYKANVWMTPSLEFAFETKGFAVQRAAIQTRADIEGTLIPELSYRPAGAEKEKEWNVHAPMKKLVLVGFIGYVPVWMDYTYTTKVKFDAEANAGAMLRFGFSRNVSLSAGATYVKDASPSVTWSRNATVSPLTVEPASLSVGGTMQAKVSLVPQLDVRLESLLGFYVNADPRAEFEITADGGIYVSGQDGRIQMNLGGNATLTGGYFADLNAGLSILGVDQSYLPAMDPFRIYTNGWEREFPEPAALAFASPSAPQAVSVALGGSLNLEGVATGGDGTTFYQWLHNGILIPGQTSRQLVISNVDSGTAGTYTLRARAGVQTVISPPFAVTTYNQNAPIEGLAYIAEGNFQMGDALDGGTPASTVYVDAFFIGKYEVTKSLWEEVRQWGLQNGYTEIPYGFGKADNHPVAIGSVSSCMQWCNARSQRDGLTPCYTVNGSIYKSGTEVPDCAFSANGYRLPTSAEWEKAARGGLTGKRFPWGDYISHLHANYRSSWYDHDGDPATPDVPLYSYDLSSQPGLHPDYAESPGPPTSPVGSFAPNGYGLYDVAGNASEIVWHTDGTALRGGSCIAPAIFCRVSASGGAAPRGLRIARSVSR